MRNGAIIGLIGAILTLLISIIKFYEVYPIFNDLNFNSFDIQALNGLGKNLVLVPLGLFSGVLGLLGGKIGGHLVQGHIDCTSEISNISKEGNSYNVSIKTPKEISQYLVEKGYIALDGTSLTVVEVDEEKFIVSIIPYTWTNTIFKYSKSSKLVNIEVDLTAKYIENFYKYSK